MSTLSPGQLAQIACILEATARKPGNVHRFADFHDCTYLDFILSATAIVEPLDRAAEIGVGAAVCEAIRATRRVTATNTNLGMVLLLAPLAAVPASEDLRDGIKDVLAGLTVEDVRQVYEAIRLANPGGLGSVAEQDVRTEPTVTLMEAMRMAADRDLVARQYTNAYNEVFSLALPALRSSLSAGSSIEAAILQSFLVVMATECDTLIARKCGWEIAAEASRRAAVALAEGGLDEFDHWLRTEGHKRNPGATADLITATIYAALRAGDIALPFDTWRWSAHF